MDLNLFATQLIQTGTASSGKPSSAVLSGAGLGSANGLGAVSANFWNTILDNLVDEQTETADKHLDAELASKTIKKETVDLALLQLALLGQDPDVNLDEKLAALRIERQNLSQENRIEQLTKLINHLTNGLPEATNENTSVEDLVARLTKRLENLESSLNAFRTGDFGDEGAPFQLLIATGLNPAQLTKITSRIEEVEAKLGRELTVEDLIAGVGNIIPAPGDDNHELSTTDAIELLLNKSKNLKDFNSDFADKLAAKSNNPPTEGQAKDKKTDDLSNILNMASTMKGTLEGDGSRPMAISEKLSNSEFNALFSSTNAAKKTTAKLNISNLVQKASLPTLPNIGDINLLANWNRAFSAENTISATLGFDIQTGAPFSATMLAAHSSASIPQAGQTHPATQMVSAHISKAAQAGNTKNITLKLDPPELGRVEVRLEFGKEKSVKAHLIVEKPETLLMLQRDASALERALQNAGLETDSGSLNYQMADDTHAFNSNRDDHNKNGSTGGNNSGDTEADDENLIETTLTWDVDAETGHVRYNLIA